MLRKELGKISRIDFGYGGYQEVQFGLSLSFEGKGWGVGTFIGAWSTDMKVDKHTKLTEEDRDKQFTHVMREANRFLREAKKQEIHQLVGVPVEVSFEDMRLCDWRILTEVL
jgi:hypothetical protein